MLRIDQKKVFSMTAIFKVKDKREVLSDGYITCTEMKTKDRGAVNAPRSQNPIK